MEKRVLFITLLFFLNSFLSANQVKVKVNVLAIYRIQTVTVGNGISGYTKGGDVTANFPAGVLIIPTEYGPENDTSFITPLLRDKVFTNSCIPINAQRLGNYEVIIDEENKEINDERGDFKFKITICLVKNLEDNIVLHLIFKLKERKWEDYKELLNSPIRMKYSRYFLIGFPSYDEGPRGTIFFISLLPEKE